MAKIKVGVGRNTVEVKGLTPAQAREAERKLSQGQSTTIDNGKGDRATIAGRHVNSVEVSD